MPYLTKIPINPRRSASAALLGNPHQLHGAVAAGIPGDPRADRLLWRLETTDRFRPVVLVLSQTRPDYTHMLEQYGWPNAPEGAPVTKDYAALLGRLDTNQEYRFRLTANPVQTTRRPDKLTEAQQRRQERWDSATGTARERGVRGHRVAHRTVAHQRRWLLEQSQRHGFTIPVIAPEPPGATLPDGAEPEYQVTLVERRQLQVKKRQDAPSVNLTSVTFEGCLRITDPAPFTRALLHGIGPAKAYGQGLLTLAQLTPVRA
jgi:CRISPR system Cascade subunit CasE